MQLDARLVKFSEAVKRPDRQVNLAEAALIIAADEYPNLVIAKYLGKLDDIALHIRPELSHRWSPHRRIERLSDYLFGELNFRGNSESYYDPRNSYLNDVLDRKTGIPITLAIVYMEIAKRLGMPIVGVGFPGHFLVKWHSDSEEIFIDPFGGGQILDEFGLLSLAGEVTGGARALRSEWLAAVGSRQILMRILSNIKNIFLKTNNLERAFLVTQKLLVLHPNSQEYLRDAGLLSYKMGSLRHAAQYLEEYLLNHPDAHDIAPMRVYLRSVWISIARLS